MTATGRMFRPRMLKGRMPRARRAVMAAGPEVETAGPAAEAAAEVEVVPVAVVMAVEVAEIAETGEMEKEVMAKGAMVKEMICPVLQQAH